MKEIPSRSGGSIGQGWLNRRAACVLAGVLFVAAAASMARGDTPITQRGYLQSIANICGDSRAASASDTELITWAQSKGMNPSGGWNLNAKLTKAVMANSLVQFLKLAPGKADLDPVRILEREGIFIQTSGAYVGARGLSIVINQFPSRAAMSNSGGEDDDHHHDGHGGRGDDDDDDDDDDDGRLTKTKPGHGHGDKNHDHTGPPGHGNKNHDH